MTKRMLLIAAVLNWGVLSTGAWAEPAPARPAATATADGLVDRIERASGRTLKADERQRVNRSVTTMVEGLAPPRNTFVSDVSRLSGVDEAKIWAMMPRVGGPADQDKNMVPKLEAAMGRELTPGQRERLRDADGRKKAAIASLRQRFATDVSAVTGVDVDKLLGLLPKVGI